MHNIDRTNMEAGYGDFTGEYAGGYGQEFGEAETYGGGFTQESPFSEVEEMELASELLSISNEAELEQFLGGLLKKAGRIAGGLIKSPVGQSLVGHLKGVVKQALPRLGTAAGNFILPGIGGAIGGKLASAAGGMFGLELEGLSQEDGEFEVAKQIVRLTGAAGTKAAQAPSSMPARQSAQTAITAAAQQFAPGLLRAGVSGTTNNGSGRQGQTGRWVRRPDGILLLGA